MARERNDEMRKMILKNAYDMFIERGYDQVSMRDIANKTGIGSPLLQHYFNKKEDILVQIICVLLKASGDYLSENHLEEINSSGQDPVLLSHAMFYVYFYSVLAQNNYELLRLYENVLMHSGIVKAGIDYYNALESFSSFDNMLIKVGNARVPAMLDYLIASSMATFVLVHRDNVWISGDNSLESYVYRSIDIAMYAIEVPEKIRAVIINMAKTSVTPEKQQDCYEYVLSCIDEMPLVQ